MHFNRKQISGWIKGIIIGYCFIGIALYYLQETFLFHPVKLPANHQFSFTENFKELTIAFNNTDSMNLVQFFPEDSVRRGIVLYFHGNKENIERYAKFASNFTKHGYEVWMEDYPGYGKSTGEITENKLYDQALALGKIALKNHSAGSIIVYGKSFGTGIAAYAATTFKPKQLILETPYYSIPDLFSSFAVIYPAKTMSRYQIPTYKFLEDVQCPVAIFQGTSDRLTHYSRAEKLKKYFKTGDKFITIKGGTHHNLADFNEYHAALDSILEK